MSDVDVCEECGTSGEVHCRGMSGGQMLCTACAATAADDAGVTRAQLDAVYNERNRCVAALCSMAQRLSWSTWLGKHEPADDPTWDKEWLNVVYINLPTGQVSWHIHDRDLPLFAHVGGANKPGVWDGHTTDQKYKRLAAISYSVKRCVACGVDLIQGPTALDRERYEHLLCGGCQR